MLYYRNILKKIRPFLKQDLIILLVGSRQVGKTSLMKLIHENILKENIAKEKQILSFDLESIKNISLIEEKTPDQFVDYVRNLSGIKDPEPLYIFIDEIQYLKNPSPFFKLMADHHPSIHLILSGSSSLEIKKIFTDRLTGRKVLFHIQPLSFVEYLRFNESPYLHLIEKLKPLDILRGDMKSINNLQDFTSELSSIYEEFVIYGSYPRPSLLSSKSVRDTMISEIRNSYVHKDISDILRVENLSGFNKLTSLLAAQTGNLMNIDELSIASNLNRLTTQKYLFLMQETFIISLIKPYYTNKRQEIIKMPKIYFNDTGIRNAILNNNFQSLAIRTDADALVENAVFNQLKQSEIVINFWRTKIQTETDFVITLQNGSIVPIEVKYRRIKEPQIPRGLMAFIERYKPKNAFVVTKDYFNKRSFEKTTVHFLPTFCW